MRASTKGLLVSAFILGLCGANGNVVRRFAAENEYRDYRDDGHTCLSQRNEEALLTASLGSDAAASIG